MKLTIHVTADDIENGMSTEASCPIALAATRALHEAGHGGPVHAARCVLFNPYVNDDERSLSVMAAGKFRPCTAIRGKDIPPDMAEWASLFDDWNTDDRWDESPVCPTTFEVDLPL